MTTRQNIPRWTRNYAAVRLTNGPTRVREEAPPEGWEPRPFMGFTSNVKKEKSNDVEG